MMNFKRNAAVIVVASTCLLGCGSGNVGSVRGQITVDGAPAEVGAISFTPAGNPTSRGAGAVINGGQFQLGDDHGLAPGKYMASAQISKATGKTFNDPQKGPVPAMASVTLADSPKEVEITSANASQLEIAFATKKK